MYDGGQTEEESCLMEVAGEEDEKIKCREGKKMWIRRQGNTLSSVLIER